MKVDCFTYTLAKDSRAQKRMLSQLNYVTNLCVMLMLKLIIKNAARAQSECQGR